jgi:hypothetical protein
LNDWLGLIADDPGELIDVLAPEPGLKSIKALQCISDIKRLLLENRKSLIVQRVRQSRGITDGPIVVELTGKQYPKLVDGCG